MIKPINRREQIDKTIALITKYTDGQLPHGILTEIADIFEVSRERIRQRAAALSLVPITAFPKEKYCLECGGVRAIYTHKYCSYECHRKAVLKRFPKRVCIECGKEFIAQEIGRNVNPRKFCTMYCYTKYRNNKSERHLYEKECVGCGDKYQSYFLKSRYHSFQCYVLTRKLQKETWSL